MTRTDLYSTGDRKVSTNSVPNQLNIKTEEAYRLAAELAALTGESLTAAVTEALRARLGQARHDRDRALLRLRLASIAAEIRASLRPATSLDQLYDAAGLPR